MQPGMLDTMLQVNLHRKDILDQYTSDCLSHTNRQSDLIKSTCLRKRMNHTFQRQYPVLRVQLAIFRYKPGPQLVQLFGSPSTHVQHWLLQGAHCTVDKLYRVPLPGIN